jgi:hypothetical protein
MRQGWFQNIVYVINVANKKNLFLTTKQSFAAKLMKFSKW